MTYKIVLTQPVITLVGRVPYTFKIECTYTVYTSNQVKKQSGVLAYVFTKPVPMDEIKTDFNNKMKDIIKDIQALDEQRNNDQFIRMVKNVEEKANQVANPEAIKGG